jgi:hypothetical protein
MTGQYRDFLLKDVPPFSPEYPDLFSDALSNALCYQDEDLYERCTLLRAYRLTRGHREGVYSAISTLTGRAWLFGLNEASFSQEQPCVSIPFPGVVSGLASYLDYPETLCDAFRSMDRLPEFLWNQQCSYPADPAQAAGLIRLSQKVDLQGVRDYVTHALVEKQRPVIALMRLPGASFMDTVLLTGYESGGEAILFRCPYRNAPTDMANPSGYFRLDDWERQTLVVIGIGAEEKYGWEYQPAYVAMSNALRYAQSYTQGAWQVGLSAYDAWERMLLDEGSIADVQLSRRLAQHSMIAGYLASQKAFTVLPDCNAPSMGVIAGLYYRAKTGPGLIHGLMWDAWQVAGGYWRGIKALEPEYRVCWENDEELRRFRQPSVREKAAQVVRRTRQVDSQAIQDLTEAKDEWDRCLGRGKDHPCPCWEKPCVRVA